MTLRSRRRGLAAILSAAIAASASWPGARGAGRDTAFYPVSSHELSLYAAPPLVFEKLYEITVAGTPAPAAPLEGPARDGDPVTVRTSQGTYLLDARTGALRETRPPAPEAEHPEPFACAPPGGPPSWVRHISLGGSGFGCVPGPGGLIAIVGRDGSIFGREVRGGHLFWRRTAAHRISRPPLNLGPYLIVAPDASRDLQALRWSDGTPAGVFRLDSDDAYLVSAPALWDDRLYVLAVESPKPETRLIALVPRQQLGDTPPPVPPPTSSSVPAASH